MARSVDEWIAKHDDQAIPTRVKRRVFEAFGHKCGECGQEIVPGNGPEFDHKTPLIDGGAHRETNLQPLCIRPCHKKKTAAEAHKRAERRAQKVSVFGLKTPKHPLRSRNTFRPAPSNSRDINADIMEQSE
jgi:5-methylcytosine-specific restriction protein A